MYLCGWGLHRRGNSKERVSRLNIKVKIYDTLDKTMVEQNDTVNTDLQKEHPQKEQETTNFFPEIVANAPLEDTSFIYTVPVRGEWKNGNLLRMLHAMFSQKIDENHPFELEIVMNMGRQIHDLLPQNVSHNDFETNAQGDFILKMDGKGEKAEEAMQLLLESKEAAVYLKKIILGQALVQKIRNKPWDVESWKNLRQLMDQTSDVLQKEVLQLALKKSDKIALTLVDASKTIFQETKYHFPSISTFRTLGADVAMARYKDRQSEVAIGLYDADSIPEGNTSVRAIQELFARKPNLKYLFTGLTYKAAGHSRDFFADSPREAVGRTVTYNNYLSHGSPQICFRLEAYKKLQEIAGWSELGFHGDEDRDTALRLVYHFGLFQEGLLLEDSIENDVFTSTTLTSNRVDGFVDSPAVQADFELHGVRHITADLGQVFAFRDKVLGLIDALSPDKRSEALAYLDQARKHYEKRERVQQKMNKMTLNAFVESVERGDISSVNGELVLNAEHISRLDGGKALLHYVESNKEFIVSVLSSPKDLEVIQFLLGRRQSLPDGIEELSPFQSAIREYVGGIVPLDVLQLNRAIDTEKKTLNETGRKYPYFIWKVSDLRTKDSRISLMHAFIQETLALGQTYKVFFETSQLQEVLYGPEGYNTQYPRSWPRDTSQQKLPLSFDDQDERVKEMKEKLQKAVPRAEKKAPWYSLLDLKSFPLFGLFKILNG